MSATLEFNVIDGKAELVAEPDFKEHLWPTQAIAFESEANEILYGGAKGPGKSFLLRFASIVWACECPGIQIYLFRRVYDDLVKNHLEGPKGYPMMCARMINKRQVSIVGAEVRFWNGAKIFLCHLQHARYLTKYQGPEIHVLLFDELTQFERAQYEYIRASMRLGSWVPPEKYRDTGFFPRILNGANPGGVGHAFVKEEFVDQGAMAIVRQPKDKGGMLRQFIPARAEDNPALLTNDPDYLDRLEGMGNPALVMAMREGDWTAVVGSMFGYVWRPRRHICAPFPIPVTWDIWRGADDGFNTPLTVYWITQNPDTGTFFLIAELSRAKLLPQEASELILKFDRAIKIFFGPGDVDYNDLSLDGEMDSAAFAEAGASEEGSRAEQMNRFGVRWKPCVKGQGSRVMRVQMMHKVLGPNPKERLDDRGERLPGLRVFPGCKEFIKTIPQLPISENDPEDVDTDSNDHPFDAATYGFTRKKRFFAKLGVKGV